MTDWSEGAVLQDIDCSVVLEPAGFLFLLNWRIIG